GAAAGSRARERCVGQVVVRAPFRSDAHASAAYRKDVAATLTLRALRRALDRARTHEPLVVPRARPAPARRAPTTSVPHFTSGRVELTRNGPLVRTHAGARPTLPQLPRRP